MFKAYLKDLLIRFTLYAIEKLIDIVKKYGDTEAKVEVKRLCD